MMTNIPWILKASISVANEIWMEKTINESYHPVIVETAPSRLLIEIIAWLELNHHNNKFPIDDWRS